MCNEAFMDPSPLSRCSRAKHLSWAGSRKHTSLCSFMQQVVAFYQTCSLSPWRSGITSHFPGLSAYLHIFHPPEVQLAWRDPAGASTPSPYMFEGHTQKICCCVLKSLGAPWALLHFLLPSLPLRTLLCLPLGFTNAALQHSLVSASEAPFYLWGSSASGFSKLSIPRPLGRAKAKWSQVGKLHGLCLPANVCAFLCF